jgi:DNA-binding transcriptional LysR family regulator
MSIDRLRYFAAVVETRSLRKAAELLSISPPSMSRAIKTLEEEIGGALIYQEGRGIGITPRGLEVYRLATPLLEEHHRFHQNLKVEKKSPRLRIATFEVFSSYFISAFLDEEKESEILLLEMPPGKIEQSILSGTVDFGLTYIPAPDPALEYREIGSFKMGIFGRKKWEALPFSEWLFAIPTTELRIHSSDTDALDMWPKGAPKRNVKYSFELLETALQTSRKGLSVLHCPEFIVNLHNRQVKAPFQLDILPTPLGYKLQRPTKVYLVARKGTHVQRLEGKFARLMRSL